MQLVFPQDIEAAGSLIGVTSNSSAADNPASEKLDQVLDSSSQEVCPNPSAHPTCTLTCSPNPRCDLGPHTGPLHSRHTRGRKA